MNYFEKLKDPRWQKKRLAIMQRDDFTCQECGAKDKTLHVHHKTYIYGNDPWDYPDKNLITLCENCHEVEEYYKTNVQDIIHDLLSEGYSYKQLSHVLTQLIYQVDFSIQEKVVIGAYCLSSQPVLEYAKDLMNKESDLPE